ncbi:MAG: autotransporter outer membrane beta-barrel domain-containing protein, partial [Pseudomonadota bacterium]
GDARFVDLGATINILDDDQLINYTPVRGSLFVRVSAANPLVDNPDPNLRTAGGAVRTAFAAGTLTDGFFDLLNNLPDDAAFATAMADALPSLSDGVGREIFESGSLATASLERHLDAEGTGVWGQIAVRGANQDAISESVDGYDSDQTVFTIGGDVMLGDATRVGLMASYADINVQDETAGGRQTNDQDIESIRLGFYVSSSFLGRGFVNSEFSYITGEVDTARSGLLGAVASTYDFDGFASRAVFGYDLLADENVSLKPTIGMNAMLINFDDALESGGFAFTVEQGDARFVEARFGAEFGAQVSEKVSGFVQGTVIHDLIDSQRSLVLSSSQLPTFAISQPVRERDRFELSAGASVDVSDSFAIDIGYLGDFNEGYQGHSARATMRIAF